jgi:hypothetical protein
MGARECPENMDRRMPYYDDNVVDEADVKARNGQYPR